MATWCIFLLLGADKYNFPEFVHCRGGHVGVKRRRGGKAEV